jgi:hypothetical protein
LLHLKPAPTSFIESKARYEQQPTTFAASSARFLQQQVVPVHSIIIIGCAGGNISSMFVHVRGRGVEVVYTLQARRWFARIRCRSVC